MIGPAPPARARVVALVALGAAAIGSLVATPRGATGG